MRNAKKSLEKNLAKNAKANPKAFYKYLNSHTANKQTVGPLKDSDTILSDDIDMAEALNGFFTSVFTREDTSHIPQPKQYFTGDNPLTDVEFSTARVKKENPCCKVYCSSW